jgi:ABC-type nickel/cobalt efflux system permease component RcnA/ABC-type uncharacterized transport system substrate-binding protein
MFRAAKLLVFAFFIVIFSHAMAFAHPHIFIDARLVVVFDDEGNISGLRQAWSFDALYSAWAIQGLDENGDGTVTSDELQPLADDNMLGLKEYDYYSAIGPANGENVPFATGYDARMEYDGTNLQLAFAVDLATPLSTDDVVEIEVSDPEYYSAFQFVEGEAVFFDNAPESCSAEVNGPRPIDPAIEERLFALGPEVLELPEELAQAVKDLSNLVIVRCDGSLNAEIPQEAKSEKRSGSPFVAPPQEPNLGGQQTGFLGWVNQQQKAFYRAMTDAMAQMRADGSAFWILGGLSFLYGLFHAAGPGHGKVVITSYIVANENELRQGILLSFASAFMQALVAIGFVSLAAGLLRLTSFAMSDAAHWMAVGSYALVMLLGVWLIWRKLFSKGHHHGHEHKHHGHDGHHHEHHHDHDHVHDEHCGCNHAPEPEQFKNRNWREQIGLVVSVGLRPCSGALVVLAFAFSQNLVWAGIVSTLLMGLGTAIAISALASIAVYFRQFAKSQTQKGSSFWGNALSIAELMGAFVVFGFGAMLLWAAI